MENCPVCGKKLGKLKTGIMYRGDGKRFCSIKCKKEYIGKHGGLIKNKKSALTKEYKRKCNRCGKVWHSLVSDEKSLKSQSVANALIGLGSIGSTFSGLYSNKSLDTSDKLSNLKKCPECGSQDYSEEIIEFERK